MVSIGLLVFWGGLKSASRCMLNQKLTLRHQLLKYADKPLSGKDLEIGISFCFLWLTLGGIVTLYPHEPIKNSFFAIVLWVSWVQVMLAFRAPYH